MDCYLDDYGPQTTEVLAAHHRERGGRLVWLSRGVVTTRLRCGPKCGTPVEVLAGGRWDKEGDGRDKVRPSLAGTGS